MWPYSACTSASARSASIRCSGVSPIQDPGRERDPQLAGGADALEPLLGVLGRRALVDDEGGLDRLEHQPLRGRHLAQPGELVARSHTDVRVRKQPALKRPLAGPGDVVGERLVPVFGKPRGDLRVHLRLLAGEDEQLLRVAPLGVVEHPLDLVGRVQMRLACRERAVLAVALARPRERDRVVPAERHPAHWGGV
jgi:hypothetical protein